jgi:hypothetical protein
MEYTNQDVRRQDRLLDEARAFEILKEGEFGILSMRTEEGRCIRYSNQLCVGPWQLHLHSLCTGGA